MVCYTGFMENPRMKNTVIDDMAARVRNLLAQGPAADLEKNLRALMGSTLERLDLVTREEYDVQRQVLLRTREKLAMLEARVRQLEASSARVDASGPNASGQ